MQEPVKKRGRKPLADHKKRTILVGCWLSPDEDGLLDELRGVKPRGEFIRDAALGYEHAVVPELNAKLYADLGRTMSNINQIARAANTGRLPSVVAFESVVFEAQDQLLGMLQK